MKPVLRWVVLPGVVTLAVTLLRLVGELAGWSTDWFGVEPGGTATPQTGENPQPPPSIFGIFWLMPPTGVYFAWRLRGIGIVPQNPGLALLWPLLALGGMIGMFVGFMSMLEFDDKGQPQVFAAFPWALLVLGVIELALAFLVARRGWPELFRLCLWYGFAARLPIVVLTFVLCALDKGTHYEKLAPFAPKDMGWLADAFLLSYAQVTMWVAMTIFLGMIAGAVVPLIGGRKAV